MTRPHGYARYRLDGCRCYVCGAARADYDDRRTRLIIAGRWQPFVDIAETKARITSLKMLGFGDRAIAALADLQRKTVRDLAAGIRHDPGRGNPPITKVRVETAAAIEAIPFTQAAAPDGAYVDATLTWARIDELLAAGYTRTFIATRLAGRARGALQLRRTRVAARNARAVAALHAQLLGSRPTTPPRSRLVVPAVQILAELGERGAEVVA